MVTANAAAFIWEHVDKLILLAGMVASAVGGAYALKRDVKSLGGRMTNLEKQVSGMSGVLTLLARQEERLTSMDKRNDDRFANVRRELDLLRRGEGFVLPLRRSAYEVGGDDENEG